MTHLEAQNRIKGLPGPPHAVREQVRTGRTEPERGGESGEGDLWVTSTLGAGPHTAFLLLFPGTPGLRSSALTGVWQALLGDVGGLRKEEAPI